MADKKIAVLVGSLRKESFTRKIAKELAAMLPAGLQPEFVEIGDLPLYNEDMEAQTPEAWKKFRETMKTMDGFIFATPEYNRSVPAVLKNAVDVGSRPYGKSIWGGKPGAVISVSPGGIGGFGANHHLRQTLVCVDVYTMPQPEAYVSGVAGLLDKEGHVTNESTRGYLQSFADAFGAWAAHFE